MTVKKYLDYNGLSNVADKIKERLQTVDTMPASAGDGVAVLYKGATSGSYITGHIYQYSTTTSSWTDISPTGGGSSSASGVSYNNTTSGLTATNVQDALDEIVASFSYTEIQTENGITAIIGAGTPE